jgi:hypothetical protein
LYNWKFLTRNCNFYLYAFLKDIQAVYRRSFNFKKDNPSSLQTRKFFLLLWVIFGLLDLVQIRTQRTKPDSDPDPQHCRLNNSMYRYGMLMLCRDELEKRGLSKTGKKDELVQRLQSWLEVPL